GHPKSAIFTRCDCRRFRCWCGQHRRPRMFNRSKPPGEVALQPTPAILIQAAIAHCKPSSLTRKEAVVSELRDRRSELSAEFNRHLDAARGPGDTLPSQPTPRMIEIQKKIDACDVELRKARAEMIQARQDFT